MAKLRTRIARHNTETKEQYRKRLQGVRTQHLFIKNPGVSVQAVNLLNNNGNIVEYAHNYIPMPATSECAKQNDARKAALAGKFVGSNDDCKARAERYRRGMSRKAWRELRHAA